MSPINGQTSSLSSRIATTTILDWLKPPRGEAIARLRTNTLGMFTLAVLTHLLPLPSPWTAVATLRGKASSSTMYYNLCAVGMSSLCMAGTLAELWWQKHLC